MENRIKKNIDGFYGFWILVSAAILGIGIMLDRQENNVRKIAEKQAENRGKISIYKTQEVEALENVMILQTVIDSLEYQKDSIIETQLQSLTGIELQHELNKKFNQK